MAAGRCRRRELGRAAGTAIMISPPARLIEGRIVGQPAGAIFIITKRILLSSGTIQVQRILLALRQLAQDRLHLGTPRLQRLSMIARHGGPWVSTPAAVPLSKSGHGHQIISWASLRCAAGDGRKTQGRGVSSEPDEDGTQQIVSGGRAMGGRPGLEDSKDAGSAERCW